MQAVIFTGAQAAGKTSFYQERFFGTHVRISLDMLRTRHREGLLLAACIEAKQSFVVDNTNPAAIERSRYITHAKAADFAIEGYYFSSRRDECLARNRARPVAARVPDRTILGTCGRLQIPSMGEGFDALWYVRIVDGAFLIDKWRDEF